MISRALVLLPGLVLSSCAPPDLPAEQPFEAHRAALAEPRNFTTAVVLLSFSDVANPIGVEAARSDFYTGPNSLRAFMSDQTYGLTTLVGRQSPQNGDVLGPYRLSFTRDSPCAMRADKAVAEGKALALAAGINLGQYDYVDYALPPDTCELAMVTSTKESVCWSAVCPGGGPRPLALAFHHEVLIGKLVDHNGGVRRCRDAAGGRVTLSATCTDTPSVDPFEVRFDPALRTAIHSASAVVRSRMNALEEAQIATVRASTSVTLTPVEVKSNGVKLAKIFGGFEGQAPYYYYLDFRQPVPQWTLPAGSAAFVGVSVRRAIEGAAGVFLLDTTPATDTFVDAPLRVGNRFNDPAANLTVEVSSVASTGAVVRIALPDATLLPPGTGNGLRGDYYADKARTDLRLTRLDPKIDFSIPLTGSPDPLVPPDFGAKWTGEVQARVTGLHTFNTLSDDGVKVTVGGKWVIDNFTNHVPTYNTGTIDLVAGQRYAIEIEYYDATRESVLQLNWAAPGLPFERVPTSQLYAAPLPETPGEGPPSTQSPGPGNDPRGDGLTPPADPPADPPQTPPTSQGGCSNTAGLMPLLGALALMCTFRRPGRPAERP
jgi:hypothetical protein